ncbi:hypothetical protein [Nostoc sp. LEGE 12450]|nr:hypothetical protein [Nostoc sp. LEGE 12450]
MAKPAGKKVTLRMEGKFEEITRLTNTFCSQHLNDEYADMI